MPKSLVSVGCSNTCRKESDIPLSIVRTVSPQEFLRITIDLACRFGLWYFSSDKLIP